MIAGCARVPVPPPVPVSADPFASDDTTTRPAAPELNDLPDLDADGPVALSIEQAAALALTRNRELATQRYAPVVAGTFEQIERAAFDPEIFADLNFDTFRATEVDRGTGGQFAVDADGFAGVAGVRQRLPTGTTLELFADQARDISSRSPEQQQARVGLTLTQSLLRGYGLSNNLADVRAARLDALASDYELRGFVLSLLAQVETAYWQAALAAGRIEAVERALAVARQQADETAQRVEVGVIPRTERAAADAEVALREQALIDARSDLARRRFELLRLVGGTADGLDREVALTSPAALDPAPVDDLEDRLQLAVASRPEIAETRLRVEQNRLRVIVTRNGLLPILDVFVTLGKSGFADSFSGSVENVVREDTFDFGAGVNLSYFLGNRAARAADRAAGATRAQSEAAVANLVQLVRLDVRLAAVEVERARQQILASAKTRTLQEATLAAEEERFDVGASTGLLVAQAQRDLLNAQLAEVEATLAYRIALVELHRAEGSLLARRGVRVGD